MYVDENGIAVGGSAESTNVRCDSAISSFHWDIIQCGAFLLVLQRSVEIEDARVQRSTPMILEVGRWPTDVKTWKKDAYNLLPVPVFKEDLMVMMMINSALWQ